MPELEINLKDEKSCVGSFIGWERLQEHLHKSGELKEGESITHMKIDERGISYYVDQL